MPLHQPGRPPTIQRIGIIGSDVLSFRAWTFTSVIGGSYTVLRTAWCPIAQRSTAETHATRLGSGWRGESRVLHGRSVTEARKQYRGGQSHPAIVYCCACGCLGSVPQ